MKTLLSAMILVSLVMLSSSVAAQTVIDRIVAVVDKEIITESELRERTMLVAMQNRMDPSNPDLRKQILDGMIAEKLILAQAIIDSVVVSDGEVTQTLEQQLQNLVRQAGSERR
ncbi:MAG: SurA N-terminal domain-containing protein, partial [Ignavibacteriales bacterium]|nr:SurA N-terminal domain-containing protein [Ignavibacteriales bacterium]